ncbi:MAG: ATP-binding protein [Acidimicrobiia bacterium]|nr:ATP-binding protein [Acidimicrobiia bacterium]
MKAYSIDGRTFHFEGSLDAAEPVGTYVTVDRGAKGLLLGRILHIAVEADSPTRGSGGAHRLTGNGTLLAQIDSDGLSRLHDAATFSDAPVLRADSDVVSMHLTASLGKGAPLEFGAVQGQPDVKAQLHAKGFGRHTFLCGQSGSGKTYTLGVILERLLLETDIDLIVLDPNSDYVNLDRVAPLEDDVANEFRALSDRYSTVTPQVQVVRRNSAHNPLQARFGRLSLEQQTMILGLDPVADAESYNAFVRIIRGFDGQHYGLEDIIEATRSSFEADTRRLGLRIDNLGVADQSIWGASDEPIMDVGDDRRVMFADLGSLPDATEMSIAAAAVLGYMWEHRRERKPTIIVIDEAHNICPQNPTSPNQALATEHVVRIAGEGRKFGLYLLLSTQRPSKVHQNVLSQCDNLLLMRMNSAVDLDELAQVFSFVPPAFVAQAANFNLGEGLAAGKIAPDPLLFKSGRRLTLEGGSDVPSTWASKKN